MWKLHFNKHNGVCASYSNSTWLVSCNCCNPNNILSKLHSTHLLGKVIHALMKYKMVPLRTPIFWVVVFIFIMKFINVEALIPLSGTGTTSSSPWRRVYLESDPGSLFPSLSSPRLERKMGTT